MKNLPLAILLIVGIGLAGCRTEPAPPSAVSTRSARSEQTAALDQLKAGNRRYVEGRLAHPRQDPKRRMELATSQHPFATILGCGDSRTSPEVLFDQGLGDLFVVRVAGNVLSDELIGSIEYAVEHLGTRLVVVLGHQRCGAVKATKEVLNAKSEAPGHMGSLVAAIKPAFEAVASQDLEAAAKVNARRVAQALRASAPLLKAKVEAGDIAVVAAYYSLDTGEVAFLEDAEIK